MALTGTQHVITGQLVVLCTALVCIAVLCPAASHAFSLPNGEPLSLVESKRSFTELQCRGVFDEMMFGGLNDVCQDCFTIYKDPELHKLCRSECFSTEYFQGCLQALLRTDETDKFESYIRKTSGRK